MVATIPDGQHEIRRSPHVVDPENRHHILISKKESFTNLFTADCEYPNEHMSLDVETLAKYPMESDDWIVTVGIGGAMTLLSVLVIPMFVVMGYVVRALRAGMEGAEEPPVFDEWGDLLKEGVLASVIAFVYQLVPIIVFSVLVVGSLIPMITGGEAGFGLGFIGIFAAFFAWWILSIVFGYVGFAAVANYAKEGSLGAGFDFGAIITVITSTDYMLAWAYVIVLNIVVGVFVSVLNIIPGLGLIAGAFLGFYALIIAGWLWGDGFASAIGADAAAGTADAAAV